MCSAWRIGREESTAAFTVTRNRDNPSSKNCKDRSCSHEEGFEFGLRPQVRKKPFFPEKRADSERGRIAGAAFAAEQFEGDYLLYPQKILEPSPRVSGQRDRESHASNCVCLMFRCCAFIAHRTPSQKSVARTCGRKSWQLTVAYNRLTALGFPGLALPDAADGSFDFPATPDADRVGSSAIPKDHSTRQCRRN